jgi:5-methylcytosine-specific restriction endonuclease McrA
MPSPKAKRCSRCGQIKPIFSFWKNRSRRDGVQQYCVPCWSAVRAPYRERHLQWRRDRHFEARRKITLILLEHGCAVCGIRDPDVLDFHHIKPKLRPVSQMHEYAWKTILKEIAKCQILCSNCHRRRTKRDNWWV